MQGFSEGLSKVEVTQLLQSWGCGDNKVLERLTPVVDRELRRLATAARPWRNPGHTLQSTALLDEVRARLVEIQPEIVKREWRLAKTWLR